MPNRLTIVLVAVAVAALFVAGLATHGLVGGGLLLVTDAILISMARATWSQLRQQGRPLRIIVILAIAALAVVKLVTGN